MNKYLLLFVLLISNIGHSVINVGTLTFFSNIERWNERNVMVTAFLKKIDQEYYAFAIKDFADIEEMTESVRLFFPPDKESEWLKSCSGQYAILEGKVEIEFIGKPLLVLSRGVSCPDFMKVP